MDEKLLNRFLSKIEFTENCWLWKASCFVGGYGQLQYGGTPKKAHRISYELLVGPIPNGLTIDHLCRVRNCVNPDHLEPVTIKVNVLRGTGPTARMARKVLGKCGHSLTIRPWDGHRECTPCRQERVRKRMRKYRAQGRYK